MIFEEVTYQVWLPVEMTTKGQEFCNSGIKHSHSFFTENFKLKNVVW